MNAKSLGIFVLLLATLGLGVGLYVRHNRAIEEKRSDVVVIETLSNKVVNVVAQLEEQQRVNAVLDTNITQLGVQVQRFSNEVVTLSSNLFDLQTRADAAAEEAAAQIKKRDVRIAGLEQEIDEQTQKMLELTGNIDKLNLAIADTERKLEASEGDREFLVVELRRLQAEKADLERQLNDLAFLRQQVRHLRDELAVTKRIDMIRRGIFNVMKGGERLQSGVRRRPTTPATNQQNFDLNVELNQDGGARVIPPGATNTPDSAPNPGQGANAPRVTPLPSLQPVPATPPQP